jgi:hypothetical protein
LAGDAEDTRQLGLRHLPSRPFLVDPVPHEVGLPLLWAHIKGALHEACLLQRLGLWVGWSTRRRRTRCLPDRRLRRPCPRSSRAARRSQSRPLSDRGPRRSHPGIDTRTSLPSNAAQNAPIRAASLQSIVISCRRRVTTFALSTSGCTPCKGGVSDLSATGTSAVVRDSCSARAGRALLWDQVAHCVEGGAVLGLRRRS